MAADKSAPTVKLGDELSVSAIGFGAMALTPVYGEVDDAESLATLHRCLDLGRHLHRHRQRLRQRRQRAADLRTSGRPSRRGHAGHQIRYHGQSGRPRARRSSSPAVTPPTSASASTRACSGCRPTSSTSTTCTAATRTCRSRKPWAPWRNWWPRARSAISGYRRSTADELRAAVAVHPIAAVQSEWSIWSRDVEANRRAGRRRTRRRLRPVFAAGPRLPHRHDQLRRRSAVDGFPSHHAPVPRGCAGRQPGGRRTREVGGGSTRRNAGPGGAGLAAVPRRVAWAWRPCRSRVRGGRPASRRTSARCR